eukprot:TRINITY_DN1823_c0_g1_i2.p1 TRINITY_DN1823_c0_g1~~TRINITY_DN1823_c0_g1_i2.p1  ORF type:complete len:398 (-),score=86.42 TRINITY_DN1823_c0_g1_i2:1132-2325(-)
MSAPTPALAPETRRLATPPSHWTPPPPTAHSSASANVATAHLSASANGSRSTSSHQSLRIPAPLSSLRQSHAFPPSPPLSPKTGAPQTPLSDPRKARLARTLMVERGKDSIFSKLRLKFVKQSMDPQLQDEIHRIIDSYMMLPTLNMADLDKLQRQIRTAEKDFKTRGPSSMTDSRPQTSSSRSQLMSRGSEYSRPSTSSSRFSTPSAGNLGSHLMDDWAMMTYADVDCHLEEIVRERDRLHRAKQQMKEDLLRLSHEKEAKYRELVEQESDEASKYAISTELYRLEEERAEIESQHKKYAEQEARLIEIANRMKQKAASRQLEVSEQDEFLDALREEIAKEREMQLEEIKKKHQDLRQGLVQNELKSVKRREEMLHALQEDRDLLQNFIENYDREV